MSDSQDAAGAWEQRLRADLTAAMKERAATRMATVRLLLAALRREVVARTDPKHRQYQRPVTEEDVLRLLRREMAQRSEAERIYRDNARPELADKEAEERSVIESYLPATLDVEAIRQEALAIQAATGARDFRALMPQVMRQLRGRADGALVQRVVRELCG